MRVGKRYLNSNFVFFFSFFILSLSRSSTSRAQCDNQCGGITFEYPFGIGGEECYLNKWYEVVCNTSSGKPVPYLNKINREVVYFSLPLYARGYGLVHIKHPIVSLGCSDAEQPSSPLNLTGSPFYISDTNSLVAVGCNVKVEISDTKSQFAGCVSTCIGEEQRGQWTDSGYKCCQTAIPGRFPEEIDTTIDNLSDNTTDGCRVAFITKERLSPANIPMPGQIYAEGYTEMELGWFIDTSDPKFHPPEGCVNSTRDGWVQYHLSDECICQYGYLSNSRYGSCFCTQGFTGNVYMCEYTWFLQV